MALMKALKTFSIGGSRKVVYAGQEFETSNVKDYERRGMAALVHQPSKVAPKPARARPAAAPAPAAESEVASAAPAGPSGPAGGKTGPAKRASSSPRGRAQKTPRSRKRAAAPAS